MRKLCSVSNTDPIFLTQVSGRKINPMCLWQHRQDNRKFPTQTQETLPFSSHKFPMSRRKFLQCACGNTNKTTEMRKLCHVSNTDPIFLTQVSGRKSNPMCLWQHRQDNRSEKTLCHVSNTDTRNTTFSSHKFPQHKCQGENSSNACISQDNRNEETLSCFQHRHKKHYIFSFRTHFGHML